VQGDPLPETQPNGSPWPEISIVTPSYNQGQFIEETIRSVLLQRYPNLEYVVIDGGSDDQTVEILNKYDQWIDYWVSESDAGQSHALNKGFREATGNILAYINSDDYYLDGALNRVVESLLKTNADVVAGKILEVPTQDIINPVIKDTLFEWITSVNSSISQPGTFWRRNTPIPSFDESFNCVFDRKFFMELMDRGATFHTLPNTLAAFRIHKGSKTETLSEVFFYENIALNRQMLLKLNKAERDKALHLLEVAESRFKLHSASELQREDIKSILEAVTRHPQLLLRREFFGRIKRLLIGK
jgi:glycosyltransferase involved in cell wall biosynthesis